MFKVNVKFKKKYEMLKIYEVKEELLIVRKE